MLTSEETLTIDPGGRRVVQEVTQGPYRGIHRIIGLVSDLTSSDMSSGMGTALPAFVDNAHLLDHFGPMTLVALKPRYVLYRETMPPPVKGVFDEFHPQQR